LTFRLSSALTHSNGLTFLLPADHGNLKIKQITINGRTEQFVLRIIKGCEYALITVKPGNTYDISASYS